MTDIKSMTIDELKKLMTTLGDKPFRAKQIYSWLHEHLVTSYDEMTNLSKSLREKLKEYPVTALKMVDVQTSRIDGTLDKLRWLKAEREARGLSYLLEVDGGVDAATAPLCVEAGADVLVAGSAVFGAADPAAAVGALGSL